MDISQDKNDTVQIKRPAQFSSSSSILTASFPPISPTLKISSKNYKLLGKKLNKTTQPILKKPRRSNSINQIIDKLNEVCDSIKDYFEKIPNIKININQFKYIIENALSSSDPVTVLIPFNITCMDMVDLIGKI